MTYELSVKYMLLVRIYATEEFLNLAINTGYNSNRRLMF